MIFNGTGATYCKIISDAFHDGGFGGRLECFELISVSDTGHTGSGINNGLEFVTCVW